MDNKTTIIKEAIKKVGLMYVIYPFFVLPLTVLYLVSFRPIRPRSTHSSSTLQSRSFVGPDGIEYKWKMVYCGNNPCYPDTFYRELYAKDSKHPVATTARLTSRDGSMNVCRQVHFVSFLSPLSCPICLRRPVPIPPALTHPHLFRTRVTPSTSLNED